MRDDDQRVFSEEEVGEIVMRASHFAEQAEAPGFKAGITHDELLGLAKELGIPEVALAKAVHEFDIDKQPAVKAGRQYDQVFSGELTEDQFGEILDFIKPNQSYGRGHVSKVGKRLEVNTTMNFLSLNLILSCRGGRTKIHLALSDSLPFVLIGLFIYISLFFIPLSMKGGELPLALAGFLALATGLCVGVPFLARSRKKKLTTLSRRLTEKVAGLCESNLAAEAYLISGNHREETATANQQVVE